MVALRAFALGLTVKDSVNGSSKSLCAGPVKESVDGSSKSKSLCAGPNSIKK